MAGGWAPRGASSAHAACKCGRSIFLRDADRGMDAWVGAAAHLGAHVVLLRLVHEQAARLARDVRRHLPPAQEPRRHHVQVHVPNPAAAATTTTTSSTTTGR